MGKKSIKCPECGYLFEAEVNFFQDSTKTTLAAMGAGALFGLMTGGPVGAAAGAAAAGNWGGRIPKLADCIRCPKCGYGLDL